MAQLLDQAPEVLHHIFQCVEPTDLAALSRTCQYLNKVVQNDELLWKLHYLFRFDPPSQDDSLSWRQRLSRLVYLQKILESEDENVKAEALEEVLTQTVKLAHQSASHSTKISDFLAELYEKPQNIESFLCKSSLFSFARPRIFSSASTESLRQLSAQLHVLGGMHLEAPWNNPDETVPPYARLADISGRTLVAQQIRPIHPYARSRVYDLRRYTAANMWGPFMDDGSARIDWEKVQAIMIVLAYNHRLYTERRGLSVATFVGASPPSPASEGSATSSAATSATTSTTGSGPGSGSGPASGTRSRSRSGMGANSVLRPWEEPFHGIAADSFVSYTLAGTLQEPLRPDLAALDPYGVTGTWMRIVCFLDYNDLYAFNFESGVIPPGVEREPISTREAFRLIRLQLQVSAIEEPGEDDGKDFPVVHFEGTSRSTFMAWDPNANSRIRGTVRQTPSGAIRWTTFSIFHGEERWRSEGVQIGGLRSARGVLGNWFDKDYDVHGPAGPTAFWKVSDEIVEEKRPVPQMVQIFMAEVHG